MNKKLNVLFLSNPSVGHTNFLISLAQKYIDKNHTVKFMLPGITNAYVQKALNNPSLNINYTLDKHSINYKLIPISFKQIALGLLLPFKSGISELIMAFKVLSSGAEYYAEYIAKEIEKESYDLIIYDYTFIPAVILSKKLNIPRVAIYHSGLTFYEKDIPILGSDATYGDINKDEYTRIKATLDKLESSIKSKYKDISQMNFFTQANSDFLNIINSVKEFEYKRGNLPSNVCFTAPSIYSRKVLDQKHKTSDKKLIYLSFGTVFTKEYKLFTKIIKSIDTSTYDVVVSAGDSYAKLQKTKFADNVKIYPFLDQLNILNQADIFITHGGKNSINEAMITKTPLLVFPFGAEQEYNAKLVEYKNIGINFKYNKHNLDMHSMDSALETVLNSTLIQSSLNHLHQLHSNKDGAELTYNKIDSLLKKT